jgi:hypothetical protein
MSCFKLLSRNLCGGAEENHKETLVRIANLLDFLNKKAGVVTTGLRRSLQRNCFVRTVGVREGCYIYVNN